MLSHPESGDLVYATSAGSVTFTVDREPEVVRPAGLLAPPLPVPEIPENIPEPEPEEERVEMDIPECEVIFPAAGQSVQHTFSVSIGVMTNSPGVFRENFEFMCLSLDGSQAHPCWRLFDDSLPMLAGLGDGEHTLTARLAHPDDGKLIPETASREQPFATIGNPSQQQQEEGQYNSQEEYIVDLDVDGITHFLSIREGELPEHHAGEFCADFLPAMEGCLAQVAQAIRSSLQSQGVAAPPVEAPLPPVLVFVNVGETPREIEVRDGDDPMALAEVFCDTYLSHGEIPDCAAQIAAHIVTSVQQAP
jgi:hypothetical protein